MSVLIYNGVCLPYPMTTHFDQKAVYDDSETDLVYTKYDIQVQAMINVNYMDAIYPAFAGDGNPDDAASIMNLIRQILLKPRRPLSFKVNDVEMIPGPPEGNSGYVDARNGPQPLSCQIKQLTDVSFMVVYHIQAHYWENASTTNPGLVNSYKQGSEVVSNRWSETVDLDNRMVTTKTREGRYVIRSDNLSSRQADDLREKFAVVALEPGFVRKSASYRVDPNGLAIEYKIVDVEVFKFPPFPAYEAEGNYYESSMVQGTAVRMGIVQVKLKGSNFINSNQNKLMHVAIQIAMRKLRVRSVPGGEAVPPGKLWSMIRQFLLRINLFENEVEVHATAMFTDTGSQRDRVEGMAAFASDGSLTWTPFSNDATSAAPDHYPRGSANIFLEAAKYYDPSLRDNRLDNNRPGASNNMNNGRPVGTAGIVREV